MKNGRAPSNEFTFFLLYWKHTEKRSKRKEPFQNVYKAANPPLIRHQLDGSQTESRGVNSTAYKLIKTLSIHLKVNFQYD